MTLNEFLKEPGSPDEETFAIACDVSVSCVRKWRYGNRFPRAHQFPKILAATRGRVTANDFAQPVEVA
ncbi:XRE family transcriptional regulator [Ensifer sp. ENS04]|jgi:hypothetical protein|uniref:XRE family transcriptional regulator n=1 Tax=Ensifer sp. ENS04 TaxID=2769281 RepID=UPI00178306C9|nr:XRE family transcriptional regulator [Ensifer sp. ENS04]MBD9540136.1 XRE family transcriptional regulator [Ensifer sp. ENS04]